MIKLYNLRPGQICYYKDDKLVRVQPHIYRRPIGTDRKGKMVLAVSVITGKPYVENVQVELESETTWTVTVI